MKKVTTLIIAFVVSFSFTSCQEQTLQDYLVASQEKQGFVTFDVPGGIFQIESDEISEASRNTLKTIKKINIVGLLTKDSTADAIASEKEQLDKIFQKSEYKRLMRFTEKKMKVNLYYTGDQDAIDEVIVYGYGAEVGVGIARVLGEDMSISDIMAVMKDVKLDPSNLNLNQLSAIFSTK